MSAEIKTFIFTDKTSGRVLLMKKSRGADYSIVGKDWLCHEVVTSMELASPSDTPYSWNASEGFRPIGELNDSEIGRHLLIKKKLQVLLLVKTNLELIWDQVRKKLSPSKLVQTPISSASFLPFLKLVQKEKRFLKKKAEGFFSDFQGRIELAPTADEVEHLYQDLIFNVTLGNYSIFGEDS
jgi:hypothetical protein